MGILDDAIREHLDLKRKHGAEEDEVEILENEAFGPPSRPGEPDFPERPPTGEQPIEEAPTGADEPVVDEAPAGASEPVIEEHPVVSEPAAEADSGGAEADGAFFDQAAGESSIGQPTVEHPAPAPPEEDEPPSAEMPAAEPESDEIEIGELELELDEEFEEFREVGDEPEPAAEEPVSDSGVSEPGVEPELGTPVSDESDEVAAVELDREDEDAEVEGEAEAGGGTDDDEEDVLEETPEFLRDTPEDERLWFEQGSPKDFDFEDEEDAEESPEEGTEQR